MITVVMAIREIGRSVPEVRLADLNKVARWIRANWTPDEVEYEFLSARRVNGFGSGDFDTEARSRRWFALRQACMEDKLDDVEPQVSVATLIKGMKIERVVALDLPDPDKQYVYLDRNPKTGGWRMTYTKKAIGE